ncbi:hematopoietic prostaglandin D synthase-like [Pollicipes pollicipes]|uniref:hematopoietic prostaglandin D synthase-like n=1 Tax=Pollicipes pollicipes TaxID=41117 RepID=UPI00188564E7|nr:hematopoietic prostaglandin D synthase-like [Pollicipes pollicipes]
MEDAPPAQADAMTQDKAELRLLYFMSAGRAEPVRWILALKGVDYEDHRIVKETEWAEYKPDMPWGQVPVLYVNGEPLAQTVAICRYLAELHHLKPATPRLCARADEVAESVSDLTNKAAEVRRASEPDRKAALRAAFLDSRLPAFLQQLEPKLVENEFLCGAEVCWADIYLATMLETIGAICGVADPSVGFPRTAALVSRVRQIPAIAAWIARRPPSIVGESPVAAAEQ